MTEKEAILSWLDWLRNSIEQTIDVAESDVNDAEDVKEEAIRLTHFISEGIEEDLGKFESGVKKEIEKLEVEDEV
jgi:hypothetical protein